MDQSSHDAEVTCKQLDQAQSVLCMRALSIAGPTSIIWIFILLLYWWNSQYLAFGNGSCGVGLSSLCIEVEGFEQKVGFELFLCGACLNSLFTHLTSMFTTDRYSTFKTISIRAIGILIHFTILTQYLIGFFIAPTLSRSDLLNFTAPTLMWLEWIVTTPLLAWLCLTLDPFNAGKKTEYVVLFLLTLGVLSLFLSTLQFHKNIDILFLIVSAIIVPWCTFKVHEVAQRAMIRATIVTQMHPGLGVSGMKTLHANQMKIAKRQMNVSYIFLLYMLINPSFCITGYLDCFEAKNMYYLIHIVNYAVKSAFLQIILEYHLEMLDPNHKALLVEKIGTESRRTFLKFIFRQVRAPLNSILLGLHILKVNEDAQQQCSDIIGMMGEASHFMALTLNDVSSIQRIEEGHLDLNFDNCTVDSIVRTATVSLQGHIVDKDINLVLKKDDDVPVVILADRFRLEHVLANLISNAIKFSQNGSKVCVKISTLKKSVLSGGSRVYFDSDSAISAGGTDYSYNRRSGKVYKSKSLNDSNLSDSSLDSSGSRPAGWRPRKAKPRSYKKIKSESSAGSREDMNNVSSNSSPQDIPIDFQPRNKKTNDADADADADIPTHKTDDCVICFAVIDEGIGIKKEEQRLIFEAFSQIRPGELQGARGSGMGLAICKEIIAKHGGEIGVRSNPAKCRGSKFYFAVPVKSVTMSSAEIAAIDENNRGDPDLRHKSEALKYEKDKSSQPGTFVPLLPPVKSKLRSHIPDSSDESDSSGIAKAGWKPERVSKSRTAYGQDPGPELRTEEILKGPNLFSKRENDDINDVGKQDVINISSLAGQINKEPGSLDVLVVDDDPSNNKLLCMLLSKLSGVNVVSQNNSIAAIEEVRRNPSKFDVIFIDDNIMPDLDGLQATQLLRGELPHGWSDRFPEPLHPLAVYKNIIVGLTGNMMDNDIKDFLLSGADVTFSKPLKVEILLNLINMCKEFGSESIVNERQELMDLGMSLGDYNVKTIIDEDGKCFKKSKKLLMFDEFYSNECSNSF